MREGRIRPSLSGTSRRAGAARTGRNEGGANSPLVGRREFRNRSGELAAMREGRIRPSLQPIDQATVDAISAAMREGRIRPSLSTGPVAA